MNPQNEITKQSNPLNTPLWSSDLLHYGGLKSYQSAREAIQAYCNCDGIEQRRQIAPQISDILEAFLAYEYTNEELTFFEDLISGNRKQLQKIKNADNGLFNFLTSLDPEGVRLLEITKDVNLPILKKHFRRASLKYHPDVGGTNRDMQRVNQAYTLFHEAVSSYVPIRDEPGRTGFITSGAGSWNEWLYSIHLVLSCIHGDFFAADQAFPHLQRAVDYARNSSSPFVGQFAESLTGMGGVLDRTCRVLGRFEMREEFYESVGLTSYLGDRIFKDWVPRNEGDVCLGREFYPIDSDLKKEFGVSIVIKHPEQAKNAIRMGMIDEERFQSAMKRFKSRSLDQEALDLKVERFLASSGFITRLSDADYNISIADPKTIQPPGFYQHRFDHLEDEQKWQYLKAFSSEGNGRLIRRYSQIRTMEVLLGLIHNYDALDLRQLWNEIDFYCSEIESEVGLYHTLAEFYRYLEGLEYTGRGVYPRNWTVSCVELDGVLGVVLI